MDLNLTIMVKIGAILFASCTNEFDCVSGDTPVNIEVIAPSICIAALTGTTHFKVVIGAAQVELTSKTSVFECT